MRLIETSTLRLVSRRDDDIPRYAILSHTWGSDEEEVTFQDFTDAMGRRQVPLFPSSVSRRPGFIKIQRAAELAKSHGYRYIWVDTCCIDKTSSAELSEAINSMFRWYRRSGVCYAFLSDVDDHGEGLESMLSRSRWFTRGWTLQELIAPETVEFYSKNWRRIAISSRAAQPNDRSEEEQDFQRIISDITGIDEELLNGHLSLDDFSVANRMRWAAKRQTTRVEDRAYCLMGLFNVNMPLLYGEGERAFIRLQEEILRGKTKPFHCRRAAADISKRPMTTPCLSGQTHLPKCLTTLGIAKSIYRDSLHQAPRALSTQAG